MHLHHFMNRPLKRGETGVEEALHHGSVLSPSAKKGYQDQAPFDLTDRST